MEGFHFSLKTSLQTRLAGPDWFDHLPLFMLGLQTTPNDDTWFSSAEPVHGAPLCLPGEFLDTEDLSPKEFLDGFNLLFKV